MIEGGFPFDKENEANNLSEHLGKDDSFDEELKTHETIHREIAELYFEHEEKTENTSYS